MEADKNIMDIPELIGALSATLKEKAENYNYILKDSENYTDVEDYKFVLQEVVREFHALSIHIAELKQSLL